METKGLATLHRVSKFKWLGKEYLKQTKTIERFHFFISLILTNKTILSKYKNSFIYSTNRLRCSSINDLDFLLRIYFKSFRRDHRFYCHVTFDFQSIIDQIDSFDIMKKTIVYRCYKDGLCLFLSLLRRSFNVQFNSLDCFVYLEIRERVEMNYPFLFLPRRISENGMIILLSYSFVQSFF